MRVSVSQETLARGLAVVNRALASKPSLPILNNVLLATEDARLKLSATNLELTITTWVGAKTEQAGAITLPARTLFELVTALPPEQLDLELDTPTRSLNLVCGNKTATIKGLDASDFPAGSPARVEPGLVIPATRLRELIDQVVFAAAKDGDRLLLTGILVSFQSTTCTLVATDGYRLAVRNAQMDTAAQALHKMIIPSRTLIELSRIIGEDQNPLTISLPAGRNQVMFHLESVEVVSQLLDGQFPDYEQVVPKTHSTSTQVYSSELLRACKYVETFARDTANTIRVHIRPGDRPQALGQMVVTAQSPEKGENQWPLDASVTGPGMDMSFNVRYLLDVLNAVTDEQILLEFSGAASPALLRGAGRTDCLYMLMPMSLTR